MHLSKKIPCMSFKAMNFNKLTCLVVFFLANNNIGTEGVIGVNWGRQNAQRLIPSVVVEMLLQNDVRVARIYSSRDDLLRAFSGSGINLTIAVFNISQINSEQGAKAWVQDKALAFNRSGVRGIFLGTTSFFTIKGALNQTAVDGTIDALNYTQEALNEAFLGDIMKVNLPQSYQLLKFITKPSEAEFKDEFKPYLLRFLSILRANKSPFCVDLFPIPTLILLNITDPEFAFPDNKSMYVVKDVNGAVYTDVFMFAYDAFAWALEKLGFPDMKIVVSQIGWPTDGYPGANVSTAQRFYKGLLPLVASSNGSPKRPGSPIDVFLHTLMDENKNMAVYGRHWGIYRSNGEPKYKIDLTGQGRDIFPARAKGIMRMPERWCVVDEDALGHNVFELKEEHDKACEEADCTSTFKGGSCSGLGRMKNVSYAFNMVFQRFFQDETKCYHGGLAKVVTSNPSIGTCVFPVEVVKGVQDNLL